MEQGKSKNGLIALLLLIIAILAVLCVLFITGRIEVKDSDDNQSSDKVVSLKTNNDIKGQYIVEFTDLKTADDDPFNKADLKLTLYENGIYSYVYSQHAPYGTLGNYYITDEGLVLVAWFDTGSSPDLTATNGSKTLKINADGTISDNSINIKSLKDSGINTATLVKNDRVITSFNVGERLLAACINGHCGETLAKASFFN